jgi:NAD(P)-dependent dehydrogenase (short-subunit alcohol dehydrogenase family)
LDGNSWILQNKGRNQEDGPKKKMSELKNFDSSFSLQGKTAVVTGGSRGLGLHIATAFLLSGASLVIVTARKLEGAQGINQAVEKLNALKGIKGRAVGIAANVGDTKDIVRFVGDVDKQLSGKGLDILVCNAGAAWGSRFEDAPSHSSVKILDLNVRGIFELAQK